MYVQTDRADSKSITSVQGTYYDVSVGLGGGVSVGDALVPVSMGKPSPLLFTVSPVGGAV